MLFHGRSREMKCTHHYFKPDNCSFHVIELVQHLEPGENKEGMACCVWKKDGSQALLQRDSLHKFGVTRVSVTSEGVLLSAGLTLSNFHLPDSSYLHFSQHMLNCSTC